MELIIALIIARFIVNGTVDVTSMVTGNQPPSKTYRDAKGENKEDGPLVRAIKAWWTDAIEDVDEYRKRRRLDSKEEKDAERARRKAERQKLIDEVNQRIEDEKARQEKDLPETPKVDDVPPVEETRRDEPDEVPAPEPFDWSEIDGPKPTAGDRPEPVAEIVDDPPAPVEEVSGTVEGQPETPAEAKAEIFEADIVEDQPEPVEGPNLRVVGGSRSADDEEWRAWGAKPRLYAVTDPETGPEAGETGGMDVTTTGKAVAAAEGGITAHINWTRSMADHQIQSISHVEIVGAAMYQGDNGPARLALIAQLQEGHRQMNEAYLRLNAILVADKQRIGDAYAATGNQAGGKPYVTN